MAFGNSGRNTPQGVGGLLTGMGGVELYSRYPYVEPGDHKLWLDGIVLGQKTQNIGVFYVVAEFVVIESSAKHDANGVPVLDAEGRPVPVHAPGTKVSVYADTRLPRDLFLKKVKGLTLAGANSKMSASPDVVGTWEQHDIDEHLGNVAIGNYGEVSDDYFTALGTSRTAIEPGTLLSGAVYGCKAFRKPKKQSGGEVTVIDFTSRPRSEGMTAKALDCLRRAGIGGPRLAMLGYDPNALAAAGFDMNPKQQG